jgi:hypothetical protein
VSCNEEFETQRTDIHCSVQQRVNEFTGVIEGQSLWKLRVMWTFDRQIMLYLSSDKLVFAVSCGL